MPWPRTGSFGLIDNPINDSPYIEGDATGNESPPPISNAFLLLGGSFFQLLGGGNLLLL